jgi:hypothetical protein
MNSLYNVAVSIRIVLYNTMGVAYQCKYLSSNGSFQKLASVDRIGIGRRECFIIPFKIVSFVIKVATLLLVEGYEVY